jgi:hypothetical protein
MLFIYIYNVSPFWLKTQQHVFAIKDPTHPQT